jgi:hypothetical protein
MSLASLHVASVPIVLPRGRAACPHAAEKVNKKQRKQLRRQLVRRRLAFASRVPPRQLARHPLHAVLQVFHVVSTSVFQWRMGIPNLTH